MITNFYTTGCSLGMPAKREDSALAENYEKG
jgi:hypothetical protein